MALLINKSKLAWAKGDEAKPLVVDKPKRDVNKELYIRDVDGTPLKCLSCSNGRFPLPNRLGENSYCDSCGIAFDESLEKSKPHSKSKLDNLEKLIKKTNKRIKSVT